MDLSSFTVDADPFEEETGDTVRIHCTRCYRFDQDFEKPTLQEIVDAAAAHLAEAHPEKESTP